MYNIFRPNNSQVPVYFCNELKSFSEQHLQLEGWQQFADSEQRFQGARLELNLGGATNWSHHDFR